MQVVTTLHDEMETDLLGHAFRRRGHQVHGIGGERPDMHLPFEPVVVVVGVRDPADETARIETLHERFPDALIVAIIERAVERDATQLLRAGADEVVRSPHNPYELVMNCEALAQRTAPRGDHEATQIGDLTVEFDHYYAEKNGVPISLTRLEIRLLHCLCEHYPRLATMDRLLSFGWDDMIGPDPSLLKTHISHIRRKLDAAGGTPLRILSRQGSGYVLVAEGAPVAGTPTPA